MTDRIRLAAQRVLAASTLLFALLAHGHEIRPTIVDLTLDRNGAFVLQLDTNLEALMAGIGPEHSETEEAPEAAEYNRYRSLPPEALELALNDFLPELRAGFQLQANGTALAPQWQGADLPAVGDTTLARDSQLRFTGQLPAGTTEISWQWSAELGANAVRVTGPGQADLYTGYLTGGQPTGAIDVRSAVSLGTPVWVWFLPVLILLALWVWVKVRSGRAK
ncbi:MAG: hypothetical protein ACX931_08970 [Saccharospirillum sp.]